MVYTIGHSNHPLERFIELVRRFEVGEIIDVRSSPVSSYAPHFNKIVLQNELPKNGISYLYLGEELGGRPEGMEFYDTTGRVLYGKLARSFAFQQGIERLIAEAEKVRVAVMCGEENPANCHRNLLIARVLVRQGVAITHIRGDGSSVTYEQLRDAIRAADPRIDQADLFGSAEEDSWKSIQSVLPANRPKDSLDY